MRDQYILPIPTVEEWQNNTLSIKEQLEIFFEQTPIGFGEFTKQEENLSVMLHAPFSPLHLVKKDDSQILCTPERTVVENEYLINFIKENIGVESPIYKLVEEQNAIKRCFGEYWPIPIIFGTEEITLNTLLFFTAYLIKVRKEADQNNFRGKIQIVTHPDIIYFASGGIEKTKEISQVAKVFGAIAEQLNIGLYYENVVFNKQAYRDNFGWMLDPIQMQEKIKTTNLSGGLCVDIRHMERSGYSLEQVIYTIKVLKDLGVNLVVHAKKDMSVLEGNKYQQVLTEVYKLGLSVAYENHGF